MTIPDLTALSSELIRTAREAPPEDLARLRGILTEADSIALARIIVAPAQNGNGQEAEPEKLWTPEQAARIACVPVDRIYSWAKGEKWASRPSSRCLRIEGKGFRRWLQARGR